MNNGIRIGHRPPTEQVMISVGGLREMLERHNEMDALILGILNPGEDNESVYIPLVKTDDGFVVDVWLSQKRYDTVSVALEDMLNDKLDIISQIPQQLSDSWHNNGEICEYTGRKVDKCGCGAH